MNERPRAAHYRLRALLEVELRHRVGFACREVGDEAVWKRRFFPFTV
ncbi:MAG: hypothetical protein H0W31_07335 [Actinobacteria bacterium]|nr:hypothetical protein [Actinomycetota bacterium]